MSAPKPVARWPRRIHTTGVPLFTIAITGPDFKRPYPIWMKHDSQTLLHGYLSRKVRSLPHPCHVQLVALDGMTTTTKAVSNWVFPHSIVCDLLVLPAWANAPLAVRDYMHVEPPDELVAFVGVYPEVENYLPKNFGITRTTREFIKSGLPTTIVPLALRAHW